MADDVLRVPPEASDLLVACMEANARDAAWVSNQLRDYSEKTIREQAETFCDFYDTLYDALPDHVRTIAIDNVLRAFAGERTLAGQRAGGKYRQFPGPGPE